MRAKKPTLIIDAATLTGAAKTAVGNDYHSVLSFDDKLVADLMSASDAEFELFWRLPLAEFHRQQLPSGFADLNNIAAPSHTAGASTAAAFYRICRKLSSKLCILTAQRLTVNLQLAYGQKAQRYRCKNIS